jgi:tRNA(Ile)-lysidine synthase
LQRNSKSAARNTRGKKGAATAPALIADLESFLNQHCHHETEPVLLLGLSGGVDSVVLFYLLVNLLTKYKTKQIFTLHAMHVHHGLSEHADQWAAHCQTLCDQHNIPLVIKHVQVDHESGLGVEAAAREVRYHALFDYTIEGAKPDFVLTAHHQNDQAETVLLQLLRGAGVKGLSGMAVADIEKRLLRPLLNAAKSQILNIAAEEKLKWCEDDSNVDVGFDRNFIRQQVLPVIEFHYPAAQAVLARAATHFAESQQLNEALADIDSAALVADNNSLCLKGLALLGHARAKNLLRYWFANHQLLMPSSDFLNEALSQLLGAKTDANIKIKMQHCLLQRYQQRAYLNQAREAVVFDLLWSGEPELVLPDGGKLVFSEMQGAGLALKHGMGKLRITNRKGGERFKPDAARPTRTLKHLLQESNIPPWERDHLPLVYWDDTLAFVPHVGVACDLKASELDVGVVITLA